MRASMGITGLGGAMSAATAGMARGTAAMTDAATRASQDVSVEAMTDMMLAQTQVEASAVVAREVSETMGTLIDVLA